MSRISVTFVFSMCLCVALVSPLAAQTAIGRGVGSTYGGGLGAAGVGSGAAGLGAPAPHNFDTSLKPGLGAPSPSSEDLAKAVRAAEPAPPAPRAVQVAPPPAAEPAAPDAGGGDCVCPNGQAADSAGLCWIDGLDRGWRQEPCQ